MAVLAPTQLTGRRFISMNDNCSNGGEGEGWVCNLESFPLVQTGVERAQ